MQYQNRFTFSHDSVKTNMCQCHHVGIDNINIKYKLCNIYVAIVNV
jgi:hypothetical protein